MAKLLIATEQNHEFEKLREFFTDDDIEVVSHAEAGVEMPAGSGTTFDQVAMETADHIAKESGLVTITEASGLEVDVLDGAPGVSSSRYAGTEATDAENRQELLRDVNDSGYTSRSARMVTYIGVAHPDGRLQAFGSTLVGVISTEERGVEGDGFEPIFELDDGMTIAELLPDDRDQVHPRAVAMAKARPFIDELLDRRDR